MEGEQNNVNMGTEGTETGGSAGPIISVIVILAILILGGLYFWGQRAGNNTVTDEAVKSINMQGNSDEAATIEADLNSTDIENLDAELNAS